MESRDLDAFEKSLPADVLSRCDRLNHELGIPYNLVESAINTATENEIAILGVEVYAVGDSMSFKDYSDYSFGYRDDWRDFVRLNNAAATAFVAESRFKGEEFRYVLTTSEKPQSPNGADAPAN